MTIGVYGIVHIPSGRWYIGMSVNIEKRHRAHLNSIDKPYRDSRLYRALRKYDTADFEHVILEETTREGMADRERYWIARASQRGEVFNLTQGGNGGIPPSEATRALLRSKPSSNKGKKASPELREKLSKAHKGLRPHNLGQPQTEETKRKLSEALKRYIAKNGPPTFSLETRKKISEKAKEREAKKRGALRA